MQLGCSSGCVMTGRRALATGALSLLALPSTAWSESRERERRERANKALAIATATQPYETTCALRIARAKMCAAVLRPAPAEYALLSHALKQGVARATATGLCGGASALLVLRFMAAILRVAMPLRVSRALVAALGLVAAAGEFASFVDETTVQLMTVPESALAEIAKDAVHSQMPHSQLLDALDRQMKLLEIEEARRMTAPPPKPQDNEFASEFADYSAYSDSR